MNADSTQNIDHAERDKFDSIASGWWDPDGPFRPLHDLNPSRLKFVADRASLQGARAADVGCGGGILAESLAAKGADVTGIDVAPKVLATARLHLHESGHDVEYREVTVEDFAAELPGAFDVVTCMEMLEHVPDPGAVVKACAELCKPGGNLFFSTINRNPKAYLFAIVGAEYVLGLLPKGTHDYSKLIKPSELAGWIRDAGLTPERMTGLLYNPITKRYWLEDKDVSVNYMVHATKP